ncbi:MAG: 4'-phosphopantetheinyl transferase superfamily protein [Candidatus Thiodiazotropha sp. (ex Epidulcina cf. delphinae)]|nr:4'-phosphopantetheinyl transferase superfamily protein [Candidatus Thiodiazotropha sp. (ex Epidulcina cf. delphinae)]
MNLSSLFPPDAVIVKATTEMWAKPLCLEEEKLIEGAVEKRQREFRAGRHAAHAALDRLNAPSAPLLRGEKRQPLWPTGFLGSITHCRDACVAVCAEKGDIVSLGIDVEPLTPLPEGIARYINTAQEEQFMRRHDSLPGRLIFSAKESLYKCYYPLLQHYFGFHSVSLNIDIPEQRFHFTPTPENHTRFPGSLNFHGSYWVEDDHLYTGCFLTGRLTASP